MTRKMRNGEVRSKMKNHPSIESAHRSIANGPYPLTETLHDHL
jgi:hypothetical protein